MLKNKPKDKFREGHPLTRFLLIRIVKCEQRIEYDRLEKQNTVLPALSFDLVIHDTDTSVVFITPSLFSREFQPMILSSLDVGLGPLLTVAW